MSEERAARTAELAAAVQQGQAAEQELRDVTARRRRQLERAVEEGRHALDELVRDYARLISYMANTVLRRTVQRGVEWDDAHQAACVGFIEAVRTYDPNKGALSTHARWAIRDAVHAVVRARDAMSGEFGRHVGVTLSQYREPLYQRLGREPTLHELVDLYNRSRIARHAALIAAKPSGQSMTTEEIRVEAERRVRKRGLYLTLERARKLLGKTEEMVSIESTQAGDDGEGFGRGLEELIADGGRRSEGLEDGVVDRAARIEEIAAVRTALDELTESDEAVGRAVRLRFGLEGEGAGSTIAEIAAELEVTHTSAKELIAQGEAWLVHTLAHLRVPDYEEAVP